MFRTLIEWLRKPRVKNWNNAFLAKQRWMTIWQEWKKSNSLIGETKNRLKNLKQNYVAFSLPCNLNKKHGIFMFFFFFKDFRFKNLIFRFIHRVSAFKKNCLRAVSPYSINIFFSQQFWRIKKLISWTVSNWHNTLFSKNICYICKGDLQRPFRNLKINRSSSSS